MRFSNAICYEVLAATAVFIILVSSSFAFSRHIGYVSIVFPYMYYLYALNNYWLIPSLNNGKIRSAEYVLLLIMFSIAGFIPFGALIEIASVYQIWRVMLIGFVAMVVTNPLTYYYLKIRKDEQAYMVLKKNYEHASSELKLLQAQVNPHFLFNTLNTIYGLALREKALTTADSIHKLGEIMRYMTMVNDVAKVYLSKEIEFVNSYIELQNKRLSINHVKVEVELDTVIGDAVISPMILIPFLENAYKYGVSLNAESWITIKLKYEESILRLVVINSKHPVDETDSKNRLGTGLINVKNRLDLLYKSKYELVINDSEKEFYVFLRLELD
jgi:two-component system LytT family sensor kinase